MSPAIQVELLSDRDRAILRTLSTQRFQTYFSAAGHDIERAFRLYIWNARMGEAFHLPIQAVEVALRNCIEIALADRFGREWWIDSGFLAAIDEPRKNDVEQVVTRIRNRKLTLVSSQIVAGLSFGFWVGMLQPRYNPPLWGGQLRHAFPHLPTGKSRNALSQSASGVVTLRNRISHHEPLIARDLSADYHRVMELLTWICPETAGWIRENCRVPEVLRLKP